MLIYLLILTALVCLTAWAWMQRRWLWLIGAGFFTFNVASAGLARSPGVALICVLLAAGVAALFVPWQVENARRRRVLQLRASGDYSRLRRLSPSAFEHHVADYMRAAGFDRVEVVGGTSDGGVDIRAHDGARTTLVQCKRYTGKKTKVGVKDVREFLGCLTDNGHPRGIFATTAAFTAPAESLASSHGIELWDGHEIAHRLAHLRTDDPISLAVHLRTMRRRWQVRLRRIPVPESAPLGEQSPERASAPVIVVDHCASQDAGSDPHVVEARSRRKWRNRASANRAALDLLDEGSSRDE